MPFVSYLSYNFMSDEVNNVDLMPVAIKDHDVIIVPSLIVCEKSSSKGTDST
jgi:hypothetical protein